jgi:predicted AAA+ superfamily ATPase
MVTVTQISDSAGINRINDWLLGKDDSYNIKSVADFFKSYNICVKYPMFYMSILNDLAVNIDNVNAEDLLTRPIYGSIVECYVRGLVSKKNANNFLCEYRDSNDNEIDIVDYVNYELIEVSVRNKADKETHFDVIDGYEAYTKILLTQSYNGNSENIIRIPYYEYALMLCRQ